MVKIEYGKMKISVGKKTIELTEDEGRELWIELCRRFGAGTGTQPYPVIIEKYPGTSQDPPPFWAPGTRGPFPQPPTITWCQDFENLGTSKDDVDFMNNRWSSTGGISSK